ncbi:MAG: hypothetical protein ABI992_13330 [Chthoniobacterales bacterium]
MNLPYTYALLSAADHQRNEFIKLRGSEADQEVRLMAGAGLVEATFNNGTPGAYTAILRILEPGYAFLRAFHGQGFDPLPLENGAALASTIAAGSV